MPDRKYHTAEVKTSAGSKALRKHAFLALLDAGNPAFLIKQQAQLRMLACGAASEDGLTPVDPKKSRKFS